MTHIFSQVGVGFILKRIFDEHASNRTDVFPNTTRGKTLFLLGDFSGQHRQQAYETYSFLILDIDANSRWLSAQTIFRKHHLLEKRRLSFKGLNDSIRRRALPAFLYMADEIDGYLISFVIPKSGGSLFSDEKDSQENDVLSPWKPRLHEKLLRILHFTAFLVSGLSAPHQDLMWFIDEDDIAANDKLLTKLTEAFGNMYSHYGCHDLGHIKCGTTRSDDGSFALEDLVAIPDLAAGTINEIIHTLRQQEKLPVFKVLVPLSRGLSRKSELLATWLADDTSKLRRLTCLIEPRTRVSPMKAKILQWHAIPSPIWLPQ